MIKGTQCVRMSIKRKKRDKCKAKFNDKICNDIFNGEAYVNMKEFSPGE